MLGLDGLTVVWSTMTWPPSPLGWSNQRRPAAPAAVDFRWVPLSCVPPQYWFGTFGTVAMLVNCAIRRPVERTNAPLDGLTCPLRFSQSVAESGAPAASRPPRFADCQTPPSLP